MKTRPNKITINQYLIIGIALILFIVGTSNISSGLSLLQFLDNAQVEPIIVWKSLLTTAGFGFVLVGIGIVLLFTSKLIGNAINTKNRNLLLIIIAIFLVFLPWFQGLDVGINNEVMVDGITVSAIIVMAITLVFSLLSWFLFSWATKNIRSLGITLAIISGSSLVIPFLYVLGPMAGVMIGVVAGMVAFMLQKNMTDPTKNRPVVIAALTLASAYFVLTVIVLASQSPHVWDTESGIGSWNDTPEGIEESGFDNLFGNNIGFALFLVIIPSLMAIGLIVRGEKRK